MLTNDFGVGGKIGQFVTSFLLLDTCASSLSLSLKISCVMFHFLIHPLHFYFTSFFKFSLMNETRIFQRRFYIDAKSHFCGSFWVRFSLLPSALLQSIDFFIIKKWFLNPLKILHDLICKSLEEGGAVPLLLAYMHRQRAPLFATIKGRRGRYS